MGKTDLEVISAVKRDIASTINRMVEVANIAVADLTEEEVKAGFRAPSKDAPAWTGLVTRIATSAARSETEHPTTVNNNLQLVMVGRAESTSQWLESVETAKAIEKRRKLAAIDVPAEEKK